MKGKSIEHKGSEYQFIWLSIGLAVFFWLAEAAIHVFIFQDGDFLSQILSPEAHEAWMRSLVVAMFIVFGIYAQFIIIQRNRAEEATKLAHSELNQIFQTSSNGIRLVDKNFNVLRVNEAYATFSGMSKEEMIGKKCYEIFPGPLCHTTDCPLARIVGGEDRFEYDAEKGCIAGRRVSYIATSTAFRRPDGELIGIVQDFTDITARKSAEKHVIRQAAILGAINKVFRQALTCETEKDLARICLDVAEELSGSKFGYIGEINPRGRFDMITISDPGWDACRMPEWKAAELIMDMEIRGIWGKVLKDEQSSIVNEPLSHTDRTGTPEGHPPLTSFLGVPLKHADKTIGMIALANKEGGYVQSDQEAIEALSVAIVQAVKKKRAELELKDAQEELLRKERLAVIGSLSSGISHEIKNTLGVIDSSVYYLKMKLKEADEKTLIHLDRIKHQVDTSNAIIQSLQNLTRIKDFQRVRIDLANVIKEAIANCNVPQSVTVVKKVPAEELFVDVDKEQLSIVFKNLVTNGLEAMDNKGTFWVTAGKADGGWIDVSFKDSGHGIAREKLKKIFEPFYTTKTKGFGFGLSMCRMIVEKHGGAIEVESEVGKGGTFRVKLPMAPD